MSPTRSLRWTHKIRKWILAQYSSLTHRWFSDFASSCLGTNILCCVRWPCCPVCVSEDQTPGLYVLWWGLSLGYTPGPSFLPCPSTIYKSFFLFLPFPALRFWRSVFCSPLGTSDTSVLIRLGLCTGGPGNSLRNTKPASRHPRRRQPVSVCPVGTLITGQDGICSLFFPRCKVAIFLFVKLRGQGYNSVLGCLSSMPETLGFRFQHDVKKKENLNVQAPRGELLWNWKQHVDALSFKKLFGKHWWTNHELIAVMIGY